MYSNPYALNTSTGYWTGSAGTYTSSPRQNARANCSGAITTTFTWTADYYLDLSVPPTKVVVYEESIATAQGSGTGTANNGITGTSGTGKRYSVVPNPGGSFTLPACSPSANIGPLSYGVAATTVQYKASASALEVILNGGLGFTFGKKYLIGQQVTATLTAGGLTPTTYAWSAGGGDPFKNYVVVYTTPTDVTSATLVPLGSETGSQFQFYFKKEEPTANITCTVHLTVPSGALPIAGLDAIVSRTCQVQAPDNTLYANIGVVEGYPATFPTRMRLYGGIQYDANGTPYVSGMVWRATVTTPSLYGVGGWNFTQTVKQTLAVTTTGNVGHNWSQNGVEVLDTTFGYEPALPAPPYTADTTEHIQADMPSSSFNSPRTAVSRSDSFTTWTLFQPPGTGSVFVPLKSVKWSWKGDATPDASGVWKITNSSASLSPADNFPLHPIWGDNIARGMFLPPIQ